MTAGGDDVPSAGIHLLPDSVDVIRPAVVQVLSVASSRPDEPIGTGVLVSDEAHVITALHVVHAARKRSTQRDVSGMWIGVGLPVPVAQEIRGCFVTEACDVVEEDPEHDLALLRLRRNPLRGQIPPSAATGSYDLTGMHSLPQLAAERPRDGDPIAVVGYPLRSPIMVTNAGVIATAWARADDAPITTGSPIEVYLGDVSVNPGNSGGPVIRVSDGAVIGICVAYQTAPIHGADTALAQNSGLCVIVPMADAIDLRDRHTS